jgi:hypothetical protein
MGDEGEMFLGTIIEELSAQDGAMFRRLVKRPREEDHPEAESLFATLVTHPLLRDLVPH